MSSLPPYSTYRTDNKQMMYPQAISHGNILTFTPPGFNQELNVKFPDSRLAVCEKCKKNYKTRDMCRVRNNHTGPPWTTAYICITLDDSCTDENGKYIDKPLTVRMVQWQPFCVKKPFDPKHPVCSACKKTNRTRSFCRERHRHRQLPWCTVYVMLSALDSTDPTTVVADPSKPLDGKGDDKEEDSKVTVQDAAAAAEAKEAAKEAAKLAATADSPDQKQGGDMIGNDFKQTDDISQIPESRTFVAMVSYKGMSIHWLELGDYDPLDAVVTMGFIAPESMRQNIAVEPPPVQYYTQAMGYPGQQQMPLGKLQQQPPPQQAYYYPPMGPRAGQPQQHQQPYPTQQQWPAPFPPPQPGAPGVANSITAGEAAAQQQKQNQGVVEADPNAQQGQWQMVYPGQMYGYAQPQIEQPEQGQQQQELGAMNGLGGDMDPAPVGAESEEPDAKRYRTV